MRQVSADDAEIADKRRRQKANADQGFSSFEAATARKYNQLVKSIKPDMSEYERAKEKAGDAFYAESGTVVHGVHNDKKSAIEKMAEDVKRQVRMGILSTQNERELAIFLQINYVSSVCRGPR